MTMHSRSLATIIAIALAVAGLALAATTANAAPASNDDFANKLPLTAGVERDFDLTGATLENLEESCDGPGTLWYSFTAAEEGWYVAYTADSNFDAYVGFFSAFGVGNGLGCVDDSSGSLDAATPPEFLTVGQTLYVQVSHFDASISGVRGSGRVGVALRGEASDSFGLAPTLGFTGGSDTAVAAVNAELPWTSEGGESLACGNGTGVGIGPGTGNMDTTSSWFDFTPTSSRTWMVNILSDFGSDLAVYRGGAVNSLTLLGCAIWNPGNPSNPAVLWDATAGTTYRIRVTSSDDNNLVVRAAEAGVRGQFTAVARDSSNNYGDYSAMALTSDGRPVIAYTNDTTGELRFAEQAANGTWSDGSVDTGGDHVAITRLDNGDFAIAYQDAAGTGLKVALGRAGAWTPESVTTAGSSAGSYNSIRQLADGRIGVAYFDAAAKDTRFAVRPTGGTWSDTLVENGTGISPVSTHVRPGIDSLQEHNGKLVISFIDAQNGHDTVRISTSTTGTSWSTAGAISLAFDGQTGAPKAIATGVAPDGTLWIAADQDEGATVALNLSGSSWSVDQAYDNNRRAAQSWGGLAGLRFDATGQPVIGYASKQIGGAGGVLRLTAGGWIAHDLWATGFGLTSSDFNGEAAAVATREGFELLPDDRPIMSTSAPAATGKNALVVAVDAKPTDIGPDIAAAIGASIPLNAAATNGNWGGINSYKWTAPGACALSNSTQSAPTMSCGAVTNGQVRLTVTDDDGWKTTDTLVLNVNESGTPPPTGIGPFECDFSQAPFTDVPDGTFFHDPVNCIYNLDVTTGTSPTTYSPLNLVTRGQMAAFMGRLYESMTGEDCPIVNTPFTDVPAGTFFTDPVGCIFGLGVTTGTSPTTYAPNETVKRDQMAAFLSRLWKAVYDEECTSVTTPFTDVSPTSFAFEPVGCIYGLDITTGTSPTKYSPAGQVTRAQMAAFLARFYEAEA